MNNSQAAGVYSVHRIFLESSINSNLLLELDAREKKADEMLENGEIPKWVEINEVIEAIAKPIRGKGRVEVCIGVFFLQAEEIRPFTSRVLHVVIAAEFDSQGVFVKGVCAPFEYGGMYPVKQVMEIVIDPKDGVDRVRMKEGADGDQFYYVVDGVIDRRLIGITDKLHLNVNK